MAEQPEFVRKPPTIRLTRKGPVPAEEAPEPEILATPEAPEPEVPTAVYAEVATPETVAKAKAKKKPSSEDIQRRAQKQKRMSELSGQKKPKKPKEPSPKQQAKSEKAQVKDSYVAAKDAYKTARKEYFKTKSGAFHFVRFLCFMGRWIFRVASVIALFIAVYVVFQKPMHKRDRVAPGVKKPFPGRLHETVNRQVSRAPESAQDYLGWATWAQRATDLDTAKLEQETLKAKLLELTAQLQGVEEQLEETKTELAGRKTAAETLQGEVDQLKTAGAELKTSMEKAAEEFKKQLAAKEGELKAQLEEGKKLLAQVKKLKGQQTRLVQLLRKLQAQLAGKDKKKKKR